MQENEPGSSNPHGHDDADVEDIDPAIEAVRFHLAALAADESDTSGSPTGGTDRVRRRLTDLKPSAIAHRADEADRHLADTLEALSGRLERVAAWQRDDHGQIEALQRDLHAAEAAVDAQKTEIAELRRLLDEQSAERLALGAEVAEVRADLARTRSKNESLVQALRAGPATGAAREPVLDQALDDAVTASRDDLYRDLERHFRGTRAHVKDLVETYLDDVAEVVGPVVDIGCGRGEWLELLGEHGIAAYGVDLNATFAEENRARGLDVRQGDAIAHLRDVPPGSIGAVTGMHLAEHLPTEVLISLLDAALQALRPGGLLILETPNPTNVRVGAGQFWIDPTHERPLHPEFLSFLCLQRGFVEAEIRPLHPGRNGTIDWGEALGIDVAAGTPGAEILEDVRDALAGGQDVAIVAQAPATDSA